MFGKGKPVLAVAAILTAALMARQADAESYIVRDGRPLAEIVIAADAVPVVRLAAEQLQSDTLVQNNLRQKASGLGIMS